MGIPNKCNSNGISMDELIQPLSTSATATDSSSVPTVASRFKKSIKVRKTRRGRGSRNSKCKKLTLFGNNINGLNGKWESLLSALEYLNSPSCILVQETKIKAQFLRKIKGYEIFNKPRKGKDGGGLLTIIHNDLDPAIVPLENDSSEILVVEIHVGSQTIRVINAYGPQEYDCKDKISDFWLNLEQEIVRAKNSGCSVLIEMDANAKLGKNMIPNDPNDLSNNGKFLLDLLDRQNLDCLNMSRLCKGTITRHRQTILGIERSVLDYVIASKCLLSSLKEMVIDEKRELAMTKYSNAKGKRVIKISDHNTIFVQFDIKIGKLKGTSTRNEIFNFRNLEAQKVFSEVTEDNRQLEICFEGNKSPTSKMTKFFKTLDNVFHRSFKKIRISSRNEIKNCCEESKLMLLKTKLLETKSKTDDEAFREKLDEQLNSINNEISRLAAMRNVKNIESQIGMSDTLDGSFNQIGVWKLKQKLFPRLKDPPTAKMDEFGNVISARSALKKLYLNTYSTRLEHRPMKEQYMQIKQLKEELWNLRNENLKKYTSKKWTLTDLVNATKTLKNNKSRDPNGIICEVFKPGVAGKSLQIAVLNLMNLIFETFIIPQELLCANVTSIWKKKGCQMDLSNDRGIFILSALRKILDKILYQHFYPSLDSGMSCSNIGARKNKNVRNHLFIIHGIIANVISEKKECIDLMIYDLVQAFDSLWIQDCMNDLYDILPAHMLDRKLSLVYELNKNNLVAVNTPVGLTERINMREIVQQGGGWGPIECSVSIDSIGRNLAKCEEYTYFYKNKTKIIPLAMVDDLLAVAPCGLESTAINTYINVHIELKKLRFHTVNDKGVSKCHKLHIGKPSDFCPKLRVHNTEMQSVKSDVYLGDILSSDGSNKLNIENRKAKGLGKIAEIIGMISKLSLGKHYFKIALLLRESLFVSSILFNAEVWYSLSPTEINELEKLDRNLLKRICGLPNSTPTAALYLELGLVRLG